MNRSLTVLWKHSADQVEPCLLCTDTRKALVELLEELRPVFQDEGIQFRFLEEMVPPEKGIRVNTVLLNGIPLSSLLTAAAEGEEYCHASRCMPIRNLYLAIPRPDGILCGEAPEILFRKAILRALDDDTIEEPAADR